MGLPGGYSLEEAGLGCSSLKAAASAAEPGAAPCPAPWHGLGQLMPTSVLIWQPGEAKAGQGGELTVPS